MLRQTIIDVSAAELGTKENPAGSNITKYGEWFGLNGAKWCAIFVSWVYAKAGAPLGYIDLPKGYASCQAGYDHWHKLDRIIESPQMGDIVLYDWDGDNHCDHTGIFFQWIEEGVSFKSYEGNTSVGNNSNGGEVMLRTRDMTSVKAFASVLA